MIEIKREHRMAEEYNHYSKLLEEREKEIASMKEEIELRNKQIIELEDWCHTESRPIVERICHRVIARIRKDLECIVADSLCDKFNAVDYIAYEWGCHGLSISEIFPDLDNCIEGFIEDEIDKVQGAESTVLTFSHLGDNYEPDRSAVMSEVLGLVMKAIDERSKRGKVLRYWEKNS